MALDPRTPVVVGVGQLMRRPTAENVETLEEPIAMAATAARAAAADSGATDPAAFLRSIDSVRVPEILSWRYDNPAFSLASALDAEPRHTQRSTTGGNTPQLMMNAACVDIAEGRVDTVLIAGVEAIMTHRVARANGVKMYWTPSGGDLPVPEVVGDERPGSNDIEMAASLAIPTQVYPVLENALRAASGDVAAHGARVATMWSRFSEVASRNPYAWSPEFVSPQQIATPTDTNRMIGYPYTKLQNANIQVDQAAAVIVCSVAAARAAGIPEDRFVFPWSGADAHDHWYVSERADLISSPAIAACGAAAFGHAGIGIDDVNHIELYSCFPSAVQIGARALGADPFDDTRQLTQTGGLGFFGGPGNNYATHGIAAMVERLRAEGGVGVVTALGWYATKHALGVYSAAPPSQPFRALRPQAEVDALPRVKLLDEYDGPGVIESFTVMHERDGSPALGMAAVRTPDGSRTWANTTAPDALTWLIADDGVVGTAVRVDAARNLTV